MTTDAEDTIEAFLDAVVGRQPSYLEASDADVLYCDVCSGVVHRGSDVQLYAVDRILPGRSIESDHGVRLIALHCERCRYPRLLFPCQGYFELLLDASYDREYTVERTSIEDYSISNDGIPWSPESVMEDLFRVPYMEMSAAAGHQSQGPQDVVNMLVELGIDPREVIHDDGSVTVTDSHREALAAKAPELFERAEEGDIPPQPDLVETLHAWAETEPDER